jgi:signal transduction histidine kinase
MTNLKKIIVVDDNIENLTAIKNTLKDLYEVYPIPSAQKMFGLLEHIKPDLILLDVEMPEMNGYDAAKKLKSNGEFSEIPIIFLTSMDDAKNEMKGLNIGAVDYIHKPFLAPLLLRRIKTHMSLIEHQMEAQNASLEAKSASLEAQNASKAKGEFLSHMSHEIRAPLNAIIGMINIASNTDDIKKIKYCLDRADNASKHLLNIINNILDMSKIEADKFELSVNEFNLEKTLMNIFNVTNVRAEEKNQNLSVNINKNVPSFIIGDELKISQIIINLVNNAIKFTPEKGTIVMSAEKLDDADGEITLRIEVADSGIGISKEQQERLFASYGQADSSISKNFGGTGLGLFISKQIIELMQGKIWIESELGKGSKFIFTIKVKKSISGAVKDSSAVPNNLKETAFNFKGFKILAADDTEINREILFALLEKTEISVDFAENGKEAVSMVKESPGSYSLILMDVHMPEMDGYEATGQIHAFEKGIPIVAMTADVFKEDIEKCFSAGMNDHIGKPISQDALYEILRKYIKNKL